VSLQTNPCIMYSLDIRKLVIDYYCEGKSIPDTASALRISENTVSNIRSSFTHTGSYTNIYAQTPGRHSAFDGPIIKVIVLCLMSYLVFDGNAI
jgi:transposase